MSLIVARRARLRVLTASQPPAEEGGSGTETVLELGGEHASGERLPYAPGKKFGDNLPDARCTIRPLAR